MNKKLFFIFVLILISVIVFAESFPREYYLEGVSPLDGNEIDFYKVNNGFVIASNDIYFLNNFTLQTISEFDFDNWRVKLTAKINNVDDIYFPIYLDIDDYIHNNFRATYYKLLVEKSKELLKKEDRSSGAGLIPDIELPKIALPKVVRKFMGGKNTARLSLDGNQKLTFAGSSTVRKNAQVSEDSQRKDFDLEMRQDLNLRLRGTIGSKIHVDVTHASTSEDDVIPTPSVVKINYEGEEDEIVKAVDLGNISLSLTGSKFISYSISSEGLFGVKSNLEIGNLEITTIFGKDEAQKDTQNWKGSSQADSTVIQSRQYINRTMYFIEDPYLLYQMYSDLDGVEGVDYPMGWKNNAIKDSLGAWVVVSPNFLPKDGIEVEVYLDNNIAGDNITAVEGNAVGEDGIFFFDRLLDGTDYSVDYDTGILYMHNSVDKSYTIGVVYTRADDVQVPANTGDSLLVKLVRKINQDVNDVYWELQLRNIYDLGMKNIKNDGFDLNVFNYFESNNTRNFDLPDTIATGSMSIETYNDYLRLDTNGDGVIDSDDATVNLESGYIVFPFLKPFKALGDELIYTKEKENIQYNEFKMNIAVKGQVGRDQISLGRMNILPGSVIIKMDGNKLKENIDFIVDYEFGLIQILNSEAKQPDAELDISYQFKPMFAVESKTLMGIRADMKFNENMDLGGTFVYHSEKVADDRPKIGNENFSIILADIDGKVEYELPFLTKIIDWLPLIKTDEESKITLNGEVAMSIPRIYGNPKQDDIKEAYLDDMESILEIYPLGITRKAWDLGSQPFDIDFGKARINWYNPTNIYARDVYDPASLTDKEEREKVTVLTCKIDPPEIANPNFDNKYWAGLMKYVGNQIDFSEKKYIEILVKVDSLSSYQSPVLMHIDMGDINEDFYTDFGGEGVLNSEDGITGKPKDGILDYDEDIGLDGIPDGQPGDDPTDDFDNNKDQNGDYPKINGTEDNEDLDTEDLDGNGSLNERDIYFEYSLSLQDTIFLQSQYKGWKLFRIPLHDAENYSIISNESNKTPDLEKISYTRIWFEVEDLARIRLVSLDLVGNKWEEGFIKNIEDQVIPASELEANNESMIVGIIDNQKDMHYKPAPGTVIKKDGDNTLEQSLIVDYQNIQPGHYGLVNQSFREVINLLGYNKIRFWVYSERARGISSTDSLTQELIIRLGADSTTFYEIRHPLETQDYLDLMDKSGWHSFEIDFSDLTYLKFQDETNTLVKEGDYTYYQKGDYTFGMYKNPTLSVIREIFLGIEQPEHATEAFSGRLYFDDIRVADPYEDIGFASQATFHTSFADFSTLDIGLDWRTQNFQNNATRSRTVTNKSETTSLNISNKYFLHKFFPAEWGLNLPLTLSRNQSLGIPRFKANSDILREDLNKEEKEREKNQSLTYSAALSFRQNKTPKSKILEYTVKNTSLSANITKRFTLNPTTADTTMTYKIVHDYNLSIPKDKIDLALWSDYKFFFMPNTFDNKLTFNSTVPRSWMWDTYTDTVAFWKQRPNTTETKTLATYSFIKYDIFSDVVTSYKLTTNRDLMLTNTIYDIPVGKEKDRNQVIDFDYSPKYLDKIFSFNFDSDVNYVETHKKISQGTTGEDEIFKYEGRVSRNIGGSLTLKNYDLLMGLTSKFQEPVTKTPPVRTEEKTEGTDFKDEGRTEIGKTEGLERELEQKAEEEIGEEEKEEKVKEEEKKEETIKEEEPKRELEEEETIIDSTEIVLPEKEESISIFLRAFAYICNLQNIKLTYNNTYKTDYEQRDERPDFAYQLGLPHILKEEDIKLKNINDKITASTGFPILHNLQTSWRFSKDIKKTFGNVSKKTVGTVFPDVGITLTEFERIIKAENILTSSRIASSYVLTKSQTFSGDINSNKPQSEQKVIAFRPLVSWNGNWVHNITSSISLNYNETENTTFYEADDVIHKETRKSINSNFGWTFSAAKGIKIPLLGKIQFQNEVSADIGFNMEQVYKTIKGREDLIVDRDMISFTITPGASYKFSKDIRGGLTSNYDWSHDKKKDLKIKTFRLSVWAEIIF